MSPLASFLFSRSYAGAFTFHSQFDHQDLCVSIREQLLFALLHRLFEGLREDIGLRPEVCRPGDRVHELLPTAVRFL